MSETPAAPVLQPQPQPSPPPQKKSNKQLFTIAAAIIFLLLLGIGVWAAITLSQQSQDIRQQAAGAASLFFSPPNNPQAVGQNFTLTLFADTDSEAIVGVDARLTFDPEFLTVVSITPAANTPFTSFPAAESDNQAGTITISADLGASASASPISGDNLPIASIEFTPLKITDSTQIAFVFTPGSRNDTNLVQAPQPGLDSVDILALVNDGVITIATPQLTHSRLYFSDPIPANPQSVGQAFSIDLLLDTNGQSVAGFDARILFNQQVLVAASVSASLASPFTSYPVKEFNNSLGTVAVSGNTGIGSLSNPVAGNQLLLATLTFTPVAETSQTELSFDFTPGDRNDSNVSQYVNSGEDTIDLLGDTTSALLTFGVAPTATPSASPTAIPTTSPTAIPTTSPALAPTTSPTAIPAYSPAAYVAPTATPPVTTYQTTTVTPSPVPTTTLPETGIWDHTFMLIVGGAGLVLTGIVLLL